MLHMSHKSHITNRNTEKELLGAATSKAFIVKEA